MTKDAFALDPRLAADTAHVCDWGLCGVHLMNDARYPWLVLVPRRGGLIEPFDLPASEQRLLWREVMHAGALLKRESGCAKVNVGALGNVVSQLHVHVVGRNAGDFAWPGPVWGQGASVRHEAVALAAEIGRWRAVLRPPTD